MVRLLDRLGLTGPGRWGLLLGAALLVALVGCGNGSAAERAAPPAGASSAPAAALPGASAPEVPADAPRVVVLGDSLAAGLGVSLEQSWPNVLQGLLIADGHPFHLVNAGVSGDTTAGGLARLDWLLRQHPDVVVLELGGNDGLRGQPVAHIEHNLEQIVTRCRAAGARVLLLAIELPVNYGKDYRAAFAALYPDLAEKLDVPFVPDFLDGVAGHPELNQPDMIHPLPPGHRLLARTVAPHLEKLLEELVGAAK